MILKQRSLGSTPLHVSELCLGTMSFGWRTRASTALSLLDEFHDAGGNFVEAAGLCSGLIAQPDWIGLPEVCIGEWLKTRGIPRDQLVIATRLVWSPGPDWAGGNLASCCEASLRRLGTDHLDILVCDWTPDTPQLDEVFAALAQLVTEGKVRHVGVSGFAGWRQQPRDQADAAKPVTIDLVQENYSLLERGSEADLLRLDAAVRPGFLARSPLAGGFLAVPEERWLLHDRQRRAALRQRYGNPRAGAVRTAVEAVAQELGATLAQIALAWVLANPDVSSAIIAPLSAGQLRSSLRAGEVTLSQSQLRRLDLISSSGLRGFDAEPDPGDWTLTQPAVVLPFPS